MPEDRQRVPVQKAFEKPSLQLQTVQSPFPNSEEKNLLSILAVGPQGICLYVGFETTIPAPPTSQSMVLFYVLFRFVFLDGGRKGLPRPGASTGSLPDL